MFKMISEKGTSAHTHCLLFYSVKNGVDPG